MSTAPTTVRIDAANLDKVRGLAQRSFPEECCGLLIGCRIENVIQVDRIVSSINLSSEPERSFEIDPALHLKLQRELRGGKTAVVGLFHSHPKGKAEPSRTDEAMAWQPEMTWLIAACPQQDWMVEAYYMELPGSGFVPLEMTEREQR